MMIIINNNIKRLKLNKNIKKIKSAMSIRSSSKNFHLEKQEAASDNY